MNKSLVGLNKKELNALLTSMGVSEKQLNMRTSQLWNWIYVRGAKSISEMTNLSKEFRKELNEQFNLTRPEISKNEISSDGTQKWLIKFPDGSEIETVFIPDGDRGTLCVSSQVGLYTELYILPYRYSKISQKSFIARNSKPNGYC